MRRAVVGFAIATLSCGPWLGILAALGSPGTPALSAPALYRPNLLAAQVDPVSPPRRVSSGCTCRDVVVNATNVVKDADIESGDAEVRNSLLTYIAPGFKGEVEIDQEAEAKSGDAIAGQILSVDAGEGCARVLVKARNVVEDADVESGDAVAKNRSVVLFDPDVNREDVELDIDQDADADSGVALAGQLIGVRGGGGPCGGVDIDAINDVKDVDLETGEAITDNDSEIRDCDAACLEQWGLLLPLVDGVQVCGEDGCEMLSGDEFLEYLEESSEDGGKPTASPTPTPDEDDEEDADASPTPDPSGPSGPSGLASPAPSPTPTALPASSKE